AHAPSDGVGGSQLHLVVDQTRADVQESPEEARETEHVVDLVRVITTARGHHADVAECLLGLYLRHGVGHGENDPVPGHATEVPEAQRSGPREANEDIGIASGVTHLALDLFRVGRLAPPGLHEVHAHGATAIDRAVLVHADDVLDPESLQHLDDGRSRRAYA